MPSASRIDALSGSCRFAFSSGTVAWAASPCSSRALPSWKSSYVSLIGSPSGTGSSVRPYLPPASNRASGRPSSCRWRSPSASAPPKRVQELVRLRVQAEPVDDRLRRSAQSGAVGRQRTAAPSLAAKARPKRSIAPGAKTRVGGDDEHRGDGVAAADGVRRAVRAGLAREADLEREALADERLDLVAEVARDDRDPLDAGRGEVAQERRDHRPAVDRQHRLRPRSVSGRSRVPRPAAMTIASGIKGAVRRRRGSRLRSAPSTPSAVRSPAAEISTTSFSSASNPMSERETSL